MPARALRTFLTSGVIAMLLAVGGVVAPASAADLEQVRDRVRTLQSQAETATEHYNAAASGLARVQSELAALKRRSARQRADLQRVLSAVDDLARSTYTSGGLDTSLQVLLAPDPTSFLAQAAALDQVAQGQAASIRRTHTARLRLAQSEAAVRGKEAVARTYRDSMAEAKQEADDRLDEAEGVLAGLEAAERRRLAALAEQERRAGLAAGAAAAAHFSSGPIPGVSSGAAAAVRYALSQLGDRYVAATAGPDAFDCSGLTMAAWRQGGVSLPHLSYTQYSSTRRISLSEARPGDLVFYFGGGVHHVGLYIGSNRMVHAANPGEGVIVSEVLGPWYVNYFSGVGRVVG